MKNDKFLKILEERSIVSPENYRYLEKRIFKKGDYLLDQGEELHYAYIIVEGKVQTLHTNSNGATLLNGISHVGEVIGMIEFMNGLPVSHDAIAMSKCIVLCINVKTTRDIFMHDLMFMTYIARHLALITYYSGNNAAISLHFPVENRLASYLISVAEDDRVEDNFVRVAQMIGCSYRQIQRVIKSFVDEGYIEKVKRGVYMIKKPQALEELGQDAYCFR